MGRAKDRDLLACERTSKVARGTKNRVALRHRLLLHLAARNAGERFVGMLAHRKENATHVHAKRPGVEAGVHEEPSHGMRGDWLAVDGGNEYALMAALPHSRSCSSVPSQMTASSFLSLAHTMMEFRAAGGDIADLPKPHAMSSASRTSAHRVSNRTHRTGPIRLRCASDT